MPCSICRNHYGDWKKARPIADLQRDYENMQTKSRKWLWELHEHVNKERGVAVSQIPLEGVATLYESRTSADLQKDIDILMEVLQRSMLEGLILGHFVRTWKYDLSTLRKLLAF